MQIFCQKNVGSCIGTNTNPDPDRQALDADPDPAKIILIRPDPDPECCQYQNLKPFVLPTSSQISSQLTQRKL
jgi:hypothetical protein